ncbi:MAG: DUF3999 family protein [Rudaea sp.]
MKNRRYSIFALCILAATLAHADDAHNYAYTWPITTQSDSAAHQIELTPEVYAALTTADLRDLDVVNAAGESVPTARYQPVAAAARDQVHALPMFVIPMPAKATAPANTDDSIHLHIERGADGRLRSLDAQIAPAPRAGAVQNESVVASAPSPSIDDATKIVLDASNVREPMLRMLIDWNRGTDATPRFSVSTSEDLQSWRTLVTDAAVLRLTQDGNTLERHEIALDRASHVYLMLTRLDGGSALPGLTVHVFTPASAQQPAQRWITAQSDGVEQTTIPGRADHTFFRYHLVAPLAITAVNVKLADDNSVAHTQVWNLSMFAPSDAWTASFGSFVAFRLRTGDALLVNDPLQSGASQRSRDWRVDLAAPITHAPTLELAYTPDRFVFLAQGAGPYRLVAGSATTHHNDAPVDIALRQLRSAAGADWQPPLAQLGARSELRGEQALIVTPAAKPDTWKTWLLWGVLVAAAAIVGGLALSLLRKA